jgi:hypothetical protein
MALRINGFLDFVHRLEFEVLERTTFQKLHLFPSSGERIKTSLMGFLEKPNASHWTSDKTQLFIRDPTALVCLLPPSPKDGNRSM